MNAAVQVVIATVAVAVLVLEAVVVVVIVLQCMTTEQYRFSKHWTLNPIIKVTLYKAKIIEADMSRCQAYL